MIDPRPTSILLTTGRASSSIRTFKITRWVELVILSS